MDHTQQLQQTIATLYEVFGRYPLRSRIDACPCCVHEADQRRLYRAMLRDMQPDDLSKYAGKALTTWGDADDFRHFVPRLFELAADPSGLPINIEIVFGKLRYAEWQSWPDDEQQAIMAYFYALWRHVLVEIRPGYRGLADEYLCSIAQAVDDLGPFLEQWLQLRLPPVWAGLAVFLEDSLPYVVRKGHLGSGFWDNRPDQARQVIGWLRDPLVCETFEQRFYQHVDQAGSDDLAVIVDQLQNLAQIAG